LIIFTFLSSLGICSHQASQKYMFYAAFENTVQEDYVTEKVYNALGGYAIPVYIGAPNVAGKSAAQRMLFCCILLIKNER